MDKIEFYGFIVCGVYVDINFVLICENIYVFFEKGRDLFFMKEELNVVEYSVEWCIGIYGYFSLLFLINYFLMNIFIISIYIICNYIRL